MENMKLTLPESLKLKTEALKYNVESYELAVHKISTAIILGTVTGLNKDDPDILRFLIEQLDSTQVHIKNMIEETMNNMNPDEIVAAHKDLANGDEDDDNIKVSDDEEK